MLLPVNEILLSHVDLGVYIIYENNINFIETVQYLLSSQQKLQRIDSVKNNWTWKLNLNAWGIIIQNY